jgi:hypothetical protein
MMTHGDFEKVQDGPKAAVKLVAGLYLYWLLVQPNDDLYHDTLKEMALTGGRKGCTFND